MNNTLESNKDLVEFIKRYSHEKQYKDLMLDLEYVIEKYDCLTNKLFTNDHIKEIEKERFVYTLRTYIHAIERFEDERLKFIVNRSEPKTVDEINKKSSKEDKMDKKINKCINKLIIFTYNRYTAIRNLYIKNEKNIEKYMTSCNINRKEYSVELEVIQTRLGRK